MKLFFEKCKFIRSLARRCKRSCYKFLSFISFFIFFISMFLFSSSAADVNLTTYSDLTYSNSTVQTLISMIDSEKINDYICFRTENYTYLIGVNKIINVDVRSADNIYLTVLSDVSYGYRNNVTTGWGNRTRYIDFTDSEPIEYRIHIQHSYVSNNVNSFYFSNSDSEQSYFDVNIYPWFMLFGVLLVILIVIKMR